MSKYIWSNSVNVRYDASISATLLTSSGNGEGIVIEIHGYGDEATSCEVIRSYDGASYSFALDNNNTTIHMSAFEDTTFRVVAYDSNGAYLAETETSLYTYKKPDYNIPFLTFSEMDSSALIGNTNTFSLEISGYSDYRARIQSIIVYRNSENIDREEVGSIDLGAFEDDYCICDIELNASDKNIYYEYFAEFSLIDKTVLTTRTVSYTYTPVVWIDIEKLTGENNVSIVITGYDKLASTYDLLYKDKGKDQWVRNSGLTLNAEITSIQTSTKVPRDYKVETFDKNGNLLAESDVKEFIINYDAPSISFEDNSTEAVKDEAIVYLFIKNYAELWDKVQNWYIIKNDAIIDSEEIILDQLDENHLIGVKLARQDTPTIEGPQTINIRVANQFKEEYGGKTYTSNDVYYTFSPAAAPITLITGRNDFSTIQFSIGDYSKYGDLLYPIGVNMRLVPMGDLRVKDTNIDLDKNIVTTTLEDNYFNNKPLEFFMHYIFDIDENRIDTNYINSEHVYYNFNPVALLERIDSDDTQIKFKLLGFKNYRDLLTDVSYQIFATNSNIVLDDSKISYQENLEGSECEITIPISMIGAEKQTNFYAKLYFNDSNNSTFVCINNKA